MKAINCNQCRAKIHKEEEIKFLQKQYAIYKDFVYSFAVFSTAAVLAVMHQRGRSRAYIQKLFEDICFMYQYPKVMGKSLTLPDVVRMLEKEYGIDFSKISVNIETENEFITSAKKGGW